jgi:hypothetical protein
VLKSVEREREREREVCGIVVAYVCLESGEGEKTRGVMVWEARYN